MSASQYSEDKDERDHIDCVLLFLAILHHETINEHYFGHILNCVQELPSWASVSVTDGRWDPNKLQDALAKLAQLSLFQTVDWNAGRYNITIHPMVLTGLGYALALLSWKRR